jgi:Ca2+-binding EF-hand superfamily protein
MTFAKTALFAAVSLALAAGSAFAADTAKSPAKPAKTSSTKDGKDRDPGFNALDKNRDGYITPAEAAGNPELAKQFKAADKNHDGKLNRTEYLTVMAKKDLNTAKEKVSNVVKREREPSASTGSTKPK